MYAQVVSRLVGGQKAMCLRWIPEVFVSEVTCATKEIKIPGARISIPVLIVMNRKIEIIYDFY